MSVGLRASQLNPTLYSDMDEPDYGLTKATKEKMGYIYNFELISKDSFI